MEPLLCFPDPLPAELAPALERAGYPWQAVDRRRARRADEPEDGWVRRGGVRDRRPDSGVRPVPAAAQARGAARARCCSSSRHEQSPNSSCARTCSTTSSSSRGDAEELDARLAHLFWRTGRGKRRDVIEHGPLVLNLETYQAAMAGRAAGPHVHGVRAAALSRRPAGKVFTRETLLSRVWGYEYYGGARTVDVHVRRLRAKLGEEHAHLIDTVRSVGYRFGQGSWAP